MEVSFSKEIEALRLGAGDTFHGEGILAITKGLLQSGVAYVGGYQGAPVSHLLDVMVQAKPYMDELGVHVEACSNEASAAAMLGASIHYPLRGAVTWKSIVGTNVAADALSNLSSPGVKGGVLIVVGEDYGEGASRDPGAHACLCAQVQHVPARPAARPGRDGATWWSTASGCPKHSNMPCMMELRIRTCHVRGSFECKDNLPPPISTRALMEDPAGFDYMRLAHPPVTFRHEKLKGEERIPAARRYIAEHKLNELIPGKHADLGIVVQGGLYNALIRSLQQLGLADAFGESDIPLLVLNVTYPLVPEQVADFCVGKRAVLVVEEGQPEYIEQEIATLLRRRDIQTPLHGKDMLPAAGEYSVEVLATGLRAVRRALPAGARARTRRKRLARGQSRAPRRRGGDSSTQPLPNRPPSFCIGCPERPVFSALKLAQQDSGTGAHRRRHRLPRLRHLRALLDGPLDPRLRHEPGQPRRRVADDAAARAVDHGRRRLLAQRPAHRRAERALQRRRRGAADLQERLHLGHRHAGHHLHARRRREGARRRQAAEPGRQEPDHRVDAQGPGRAVDAHRAHLRRRQDAQDAQRRLHQRLQRPEGDHRRGRMPARAPAPHQALDRQPAARRASAWCA